MRRGPHLEAGANRYGPRVPAPNRHELNHLSPSADTPGATLAAACLAVLYSQTRSSVLPRASVGNVSWMRTVPIAGPHDTAIAVEGRISLRSELAGDPAEDCAESLGSIASIIGVRHAQQHEVSDVRQAEQAYPKPGEVCRERG
jgi:hypothetical protein